MISLRAFDIENSLLDSVVIIVNDIFCLIILVYSNVLENFNYFDLLMQFFLLFNFPSVERDII